jgi:hypothetical protein
VDPALERYFARFVEDRTHALFRVAYALAGISTPPRTCCKPRLLESPGVGRTFVAMARRTSSEARTGHTTALPNVPYDGGSVAWLAGGAEIAIDTQATKGQAHSAATGTATRQVPSFGTVTAWSPDRRYVVRDRNGSPTIVGSVTGDVIGDLGGNWYASRIYGSGNTSVIVGHSGGPTPADNSWIQLDLTGHELATIRCPRSSASATVRVHARQTLTGLANSR